MVGVFYQIFCSSYDLGILISSLCHQETSATDIMAGSVYIVLMMSCEYTPSY